MKQRHPNGAATSAISATRTTTSGRSRPARSSGLEESLQSAEVRGHGAADHPGEERAGQSVDAARFVALDPDRHPGSAADRLERVGHGPPERAPDRAHGQAGGWGPLPDPKGVLDAPTP